MNLLLFLGAGFSADAGLPMQNNFFEFAHMEYKKGKLNKSQYAGITATQWSIMKLSGKTDPTMEEAFGMLDYTYYMEKEEYRLAHMWGDDNISFLDSKLTVEVARSYFLRALESIFSYNREYNTYINHEIYYNFISELLEYYNVYIITTNYDLVIESVLNKMTDRDIILFPEMGSQAARNEYHPVPLLKLHGSIDWKETKIDTPNIIPPTWSKHFDRGSKYNRIWNDAEKAIGLSDKIVFIGYSMPEIDIQIKYLMKWGGIYGIMWDKIKDVYVVKPSWNEKDERNFSFLKDAPRDVSTNMWAIKSFEYLPYTFKQFAQSEFIDHLQNKE